MKSIEHYNKKLFFKDSYRLTRLNLRIRHKLLGEGCSGEVYEIDDDTVIKLNAGTGNYSFYEYAFNTKKKHLPRIHDIKLTKDYYLIRAEKLFHLPFQDGLDISDYMQNKLNGLSFGGVPKDEYTEQLNNMIKLFDDIRLFKPDINSFFDDNPLNFMITHDGELILNDPY